MFKMQAGAHGSFPAKVMGLNVTVEWSVKSADRSLRNRMFVWGPDGVDTKKFAREVASLLGLAVYSWSRTAGCGCGCSPGLLLKSENRLEVFATVTLDEPPALPEPKFLCEHCECGVLLENLILNSAGQFVCKTERECFANWDAARKAKNTSS